MAQQVDSSNSRNWEKKEVGIRMAAGERVLSKSDFVSTTMDGARLGDPPEETYVIIASDMVSEKTTVPAPMVFDAFIGLLAVMRFMMGCEEPCKHPYTVGAPIPDGRKEGGGGG